MIGPLIGDLSGPGLIRFDHHFDPEPITFLVQSPIMFLEHWFFSDPHLDAKVFFSLGARHNARRTRLNDVKCNFECTIIL